MEKIRSLFKANVHDVYNRINRDNIPPAIIRQLEVDIPRCHQYDEILSSPEGHQKLKNVLKVFATSLSMEDEFLCYYSDLDCQSYASGLLARS